VTTRIRAELAAEVKARAAGRCEYCHAPQILIGQAFHIDHILPRSVGGLTISENLCFACSHCNAAKGKRWKALDARTQCEVPLFNPRKEEWEMHFRWSADWSRVTGRTGSGRVTVACLDMNAEVLRLARPYWRIVGLIP
jgi:5-methylcytosine-specific restriction endonuclease McrA